MFFEVGVKIVQLNIPYPVGNHRNLLPGIDNEPSGFQHTIGCQICGKLDACISQKTRPMYLLLMFNSAAMDASVSAER